MEFKQWELSFGIFEGVLLGYRNYTGQALGTDVSSKVDHVLYIGIFDICLTLYYGD
jgi:hypothetical protein